MEKTRDILIIGSGQLGGALARLYADDATLITRKQLDLEAGSAEDYRAMIDQYKPRTIINTAAYTKVDKAEEEQSRAMQVNATAPGMLADACAAAKVRLVHYSTDYVFDGSGAAPWKESDAACPINYYGKTKLAGEQLIAQSGADHLIFRISWVYDETGQNFLNTMLTLGAQREALSIVHDQIGSPCYAGDIAVATGAAIQIWDSQIPSGIYHMCHVGQVSWYGFAEKIFKQARRLGQPLAVKTLTPIDTADYPTPAKRPLNSRMSTDKLKQHFAIELPTWHDGLTRCMENKYAG